MTYVEPVAQRLRAIMDTTPVVERAPIPQDAAVELDNDLRLLCAETAARLCAEDYPANASGTQLQQHVLLANIAVAETLAAQIAVLQQQLWVKAEKAGITQTAVARARDVTQQAHSKALKPSKKAQPK